MKVPASVLTTRNNDSSPVMKTMAFFASFCMINDLNPSDASELLMLLANVVDAGTEYTNSGKSEDDQRYQQLMTEWEQTATTMGFTNIEWPGFFPTATKGDNNIVSWPTSRMHDNDDGEIS